MKNLSEERRNFILSEFSYIQLFNKPSDAYDYEGFTLGNIAKKYENTNLKYDGSLAPSDVKEIFKEIQSDPELSNLTFTNYENKNASGNFDGFVAYSFKDPEGNAHFAFRGSESNTPEGQQDGFLGVDWTDNYTMGIEGKSRQFQDVKSFVAANSVGSAKIYVTGHSKGGANALYACSQFPNATGIAFDAPGIDEAISASERERLRESGITNYVASDDKVGALLFHSENRVFCKMNETYYLELDDKIVKVNNYNQGAGQNVGTDTFIPHALQAFFWDKNNNLVKENRSSGSMLTEALTQSLYDWNIRNGRPLDKYLDWIIKNKNNLGKNLEKIIFEKLVGEFKEGSPGMISDILTSVLYGKEVTVEVLEETLERYIKLDNVFDKMLAELNNMKEKFVSDLEDDVEKIEDDVESEFFDRENFEFVKDIESTAVAIVDEDANVFSEGVQKVGNIIKGGFSSAFGYGAASTRTRIYVDFDKLREAADRLEVLRRRACDIEERVNELYFNVDLRKNILTLLKSSYMEYSSDKFRENIDYLNYACDTFQRAERTLFKMASR
ncbi:Mbeg1-like protein [Clostridium hydrogenum]|uniref:Mbeg1-like protein n=1 Tax=Clostridium hydrogenum TaxID=2855764 RepID=UPI001F3E8C53|nr:Mbeg1-like protein [Clostridium hydrogenum]